jgi:hypothetical protein
MSISQGILGCTTTYRQQNQDSNRVKMGARILRDAMIADMKKKASRPARLPKDWRNRIIK